MARAEPGNVESFRAQASRAGRSLEAELLQTLTDVACERHAELLGEIDAFRDEFPAARCGELPDSTPLIHEVREKDIG
jgi:hypothetical protein